MEARDFLMKQKSQVMTDEYLKKCDQPSLRYLTGKGLKIREKIWKALKQ